MLSVNNYVCPIISMLPSDNGLVLPSLVTVSIHTGCNST